MATFAELCVMAPSYRSGVLYDTENRLTVEVAMPADPSSLLGKFVLGTSKLSSKRWYDVTERLRGLQIERGSSAGDRYDPGTCTIELDNEDKSLSPYTSDDFFFGSSNVHLGPGTLVRVSIHSPNYEEAANLTLADFSTAEASVQSDGEYWFSFVNGNNQSAVSQSNIYFDETAVQFQTTSFPANAVGYVRDCYAGLLGTGVGSNAAYFIRGEDGQLECMYRLAGVETTVTVEGSSHKFWQLKEESGTLYWQTSFDGINWTTQRSVTSGAWLTDVQAVIFTNVTSASGNLSAADGWHVHAVNPYPVPGEWLALFTGLVEQWDDYRDALGQTGTVMITANETLSVLAAIDENATTLAGSGDTYTQRVQRLADAANWQFGYNHLGSGSGTFQSTDMSANRLSELYLTADSVDSLLYSGKDGRLTYGSRANGGIWSDQMFGTGGEFVVCGSSYWTDYGDSGIDLGIDVRPEDITTANNDDLLITKITLARVGGSAVSYETSYLSGRYQTRSYSRNDLITQNPGADADLLTVSEGILGRSEFTYRPYSFGLDGKREGYDTFAITCLDVGQTIRRILLDDVCFTDFIICGYTIRITPLSDDLLNITADVRVEPGNESRWYTCYPSAAAPANDNWANATTITTSAAGTVRGTTAGATVEGSEPVGYYENRSVWYKFTAGATGTIILDTGLSLNRSTSIGLYTGASLAALSLVGQDQGGGPRNTAYRSFSVTSGTTYYVRVGCLDYPGSDFTLRWTAIT